MKFGPVPLSEAEGAVLAHSITADGFRLKKGTVIAARDVAAMEAVGFETVIVARLSGDDMPEDDAALSLAEALVAPGLKLGPVFTGRVNLLAEAAGVVRVDARAIANMNSVHEGLTIATLPDYQRVHADQLVATVKIIPYGLPKSIVADGVAALGEGALQLHAFVGGTARLVLTETPGFKKSLLSKGEAVVRERVETLGYRLSDVVTVAHRTEAVADVLETDADLIMILGASATSDRDDVAPAAVVAAGGQIERFGMPVDPGNLLFLGSLDGRPVVGLPGCARSPALNGVDWVLERLAAGLPVSGADIAAMGVGGLLKEMPDRPQPRRPKST